MWRGPNIWFGSRRALRYKANIVMTDVWRRGSGSLKDPFVFSIKAERGKRGKGPGRGGREVRWLPPVRSTLRITQWGWGVMRVFVFAMEKERERERESLCQAVGNRPDEVWELFWLLSFT